MERREVVTELRSTVEQVIDQQVKSAVGSWPDMTKHAKSGEADYVKVGQKDGRLTQFGLHKGTLWGIGLRGIASKQHREIGAHDVYLALTSKDSQDDVLERRVYVPSSFLGHTAVRELETDEDYTSALTIVRSPHIAADAVEYLLVLQDEEQEALAEQLAEDRRSNRKLQEDLEAIDRAQREAYANSKNIILR